MQSWEQCFGNENRFIALASHLQKRDVGLLVQSSVDISRNVPLDAGCLQFYLITGIHLSGTNALLLKKLPSRDEIMSHDSTRGSRPRDEAMMKKVDNLLDAIPLQDFNPLAISSRFHEKLEDLMKRSPVSVQPKNPVSRGQLSDAPSNRALVGGTRAREPPLQGRAVSAGRRNRLMTHRIHKSN